MYFHVITTKPSNQEIESPPTKLPLDMMKRTDAFFHLARALISDSTHTGTTLWFQE